MIQKRTKLLTSLVALNGCLKETCSELSRLGWDSSHDLVLLTKNHALSALRRFLDGSLSASEVEEWANAIEGREDIGFEGQNEDMLQELIYELANPILTRPLTSSSAAEWIARLEGSS